MYRIYAIVLFTLFCLKRVKSKEKRDASHTRVHRERCTWPSFVASLSKKQFQMVFQMDIECFNMLCNRIEASVGADKFCSFEYLEGIKHVPSMTYIAHEESTGGIIPAEVKLERILRLLAGASYLDLGLLYALSYRHTYELFHTVLHNWIINDTVLSIEFYSNMTDIQKMK